LRLLLLLVATLLLLVSDLRLLLLVSALLRRAAALGGLELPGALQRLRRTGVGASARAPRCVGARGAGGRTAEVDWWFGRWSGGSLRTRRLA
jgi:hypothetical protein